MVRKSGLLAICVGTFLGFGPAALASGAEQPAKPHPKAAGAQNALKAALKNKKKAPAKQKQPAKKPGSARR